MFADTLAEKDGLAGERAALVLEDGRSLTYRELAQQADAALAQADALAGAALRPHVAIGIECTNAVPTVCAYLGALRRRIPALLVDARLHPDLREGLYRRFGIEHVCSEEGHWRRTGHGVHAVPAHPDLALLLSTSGSTGDAKLVKLTRANLQANAASISTYLELSPAERPVTTLPLHYSYGLSVLNSHLLAGAAVLLTDTSVTGAAFWNFAREHGATSLSGVPATYAMLRRLRFERMALPGLKTLTQAGGAMPLDDTRWFAEHAEAAGRRLVVMYGQTEATARMAYVPPEQLLDKLGAIGIAIPGGALQLVDAQGEPVTVPRQPGELVYRGPNVMMGYATCADDLALPDLQQQRLHTGDLGWQDESGCFYLSGRLKRFIKVFGNRIGLDELESQLRQLGHEVAVTGRDDLLMVACIGNDADAPALAARIASRYRLHPSAIKVALFEALPMSSSGKVQYQELQKRFIA